MSFLIAGLGTAVPEHSIDQDEAAETAATLCGAAAEQRRLVRALYRRSGVKTRRSVLLESSSDGGPARQSFYRQMTSEDCGEPTTGERMARYESAARPLALAAARSALDDARVSPRAVTHLITVSCSGFSAPGFDLARIRELSLSPATTRTHVGFMGCHGALNALRVAKAFAEADARACVLICAVELCSLHHRYDQHADQIVANALFSDGAAALIGRRTGTASSADWQLVASGSLVLPDSEELMGWRIGDRGFEMVLSPRVPDQIHQHLRPWMSEWLGRHGLAIESVGSWAIHPGGPRILQACAEALQLAPQQLAESHQTLAELGNMSSPTVLFILDRLRRRQAPRPCVALAFGPGLAAEAALIV